MAIDWNSIRELRNALLSGTDWAVMPDSPLSEDRKQEYIEYREALRDLPNTYADSDEVHFPYAPLPENMPEEIK